MNITGRLDRFERLDASTTAEILELLTIASDADGVYPLSEHVVLHLRHGGEVPAVHLLIRTGAPDSTGSGALVGYAHVDTTDVVSGAAAELVVHPMHRRRGLGRQLVQAATGISVATNSRRLRLWAHGDHPSASALAMSLGFERWRVLWQMRRSLYAPVGEPKLPSGVRLRPFQPGVDDSAWLELNGAAFADHPDQGRWALPDLRIRLAEPWFDASGFLLAEDESGKLLGFHWTKVHGGGPAESHAHDPIGEVYVLGLAPQARGTGLATALTLAGLRHLRGRGLDQAMLYVDETNTAAVRLYERMGFARWSTDVCFQRLTPAP